MNRLDPDTAELLRLVHAAALDKQAREPVALDLTGLTTMTDVLYTCHGDSGRAVDAISDAIVRRLAKAGHRVGHVEGKGGQRWVLIDLGTVMVHVFEAETREYYALEKLWADARPIELPDA